MTGMSLPRGIEERIDWHQTHNPSTTGMCAQHTWHALGGDQGVPPAWGAADANACVDKVKASGRYWTPGSWDGPPPRGAWVGWKYGDSGHAALSLGDGRISTTDPSGGQGMVGIEPLDYPKKWGFNDSGGDYTVWTDEYNGVRFDVGAAHGEVLLSKLRHGQQDSDSVRRLQTHLNAHSLEPPGHIMLPITGNYGEQTDTVVRADQDQHGSAFGQASPDPVGASSVGPKQAAHLIPGGCGCAIINDLTNPDPEPPPEEGGEDGGDAGAVWSNYSGKPSGTLTIAADAGYVQVDASVAAAPGDGLEFHMLYANLDLTWASGSQDGWIRAKYVRDGGDATGYQDYSVVRGMGDFLLTCTHWEAGEKGVGGRWHLNVGGGIAKAVADTRYVKAGGILFA